MLLLNGLKSYFEVDLSTDVVFASVSGLKPEPSVKDWLFFLETWAEPDVTQKSFVSVVDRNIDLGLVSDHIEHCLVVPYRRSDFLSSTRTA